MGGLFSRGLVEGEAGAEDVDGVEGAVGAVGVVEEKTRA